MASDLEQKTYPTATVAVFALFAVAVYLHGLDVPLLGPDEPRYSQVAREMFERRDWITPTLGGFDWFEKPALLYWLQIASYRLFGVSEFSARFGSALFGLGTILSLWVLGRSWSRRDEKVTEDERRETDGSRRLLPSTTLFVAASSLGLLVFSRGASFDIIITFPMTAALAAYFIYETSESKSGIRGSAALLVFYLFCGISLIAKGLIGIVFPFAIVGFYHLLVRRTPSRHAMLSLVWGAAVAFLAAAAWYLPMYLENGWKFIDEFIIQHHFQRYTSNKYLHPQPFWFFWVIFPLMVLPWMPFFLAAVWRSASKALARFKGGQVAPLSPYRMFAAAWMLVPLIFFSFSGSKLPGYILPALPGAVLLTADFVAGLAARSARWRGSIPVLGFITLAVVSLLVAIPLRSWARHETVRELVEAGRSKGFHWQRIYGLHTVSHSLEFYGAGRLVRTDASEGRQRKFDGSVRPAEEMTVAEKESVGKQRRFFGPSEIADEMAKRGEETALVLVPLEYRSQLEEGKLLEATFLADNGELAIYSVRTKR